MATYWSRILPDGSGDRGKTIQDSVFNKGRKSISIDEERDVDVGHMFAVYVDVSTFLQQQSHGYWDVYGCWPAKEVCIKVHLNPDREKPQSYYRLHAR